MVNDTRILSRVLSSHVEDSTTNPNEMEIEMYKEDDTALASVTMRICNAENYECKIKQELSRKTISTKNGKKDAQFGCGLPP